MYMSKTCQNCNQTNLPQATFCSNCASPLPPSNFGGGQQQGNQQWNQPNFGGQQGQNFARPANSDGVSERATLAAVLGFAGFFCCSIFTAIPAIYIGWTELKSINDKQASKYRTWCAMSGVIVGIATIVLHVGGFGFWILMVLLAAASDPYGGY